MTRSAQLAAMAVNPYVSLSTFRRDGTPVPTPVWIADDGTALVVIAAAATGKVRRLRRDPRVRLQPCDLRGRVPDGAPVIEGRAAVVPQDVAAHAALRATYGWQYGVALLIQRLRSRRAGRRVVLRVTDAADDGRGATARDDPGNRR